MTSSTITVPDGTTIYYKDWGSGPPIVFSHGWPLNGDAWEDQMLFLASRGYRCIAHDRRGHGRSSQPWNGNEMNQYADDLAALMEGARSQRRGSRRALDRRRRDHALRRAAWNPARREDGPGRRHPADHGQDRGQSRWPADRRVRRVCAPRPLGDRSQLYKDLASGPFFGFNRPGAKASQGLIDAFWLAGMQAGAKGDVRLHQGVLRDRLHGGPQEDRRAHADSSTVTTTRSCRSTPRRWRRPSW